MALDRIRARPTRGAVVSLIASAALGALVPFASAADEITVIAGGGARRAKVLLIDGPQGPEAALEEVGAGLDLQTTRAEGRVTLKGRGGEVVLENGKSLFNVGGQVKALSSPVRIVGNRTYLAPPNVATVLAAALGDRVQWRAPFRAMVIGPYDAPRATVTTSVGPTSVTVAIELSRRTPIAVRRETGRVVAELGTDVVDSTFRDEALPGRIVESARFEAKAPPAFSFALGDRFSSLRTSESEGPPYRFTLEFQMAAATATPAPLAGAAPGSLAGAARPSPTSPVDGFAKPLVVVIDPGHGGSDTGAMGPGGHFEKDLAMSIGRRLRSAIVDSIGGQAYLTRDGDANAPPLDDRAAIANNYNADVFISLHANGSRAVSARGTEVFFLSYGAVDDESRRLALAEGTFAAPQSGGGADQDVGLILWDMAQAAHLQSSQALAAELQNELSRATSTPMRGVKQAPFRVLVGARMPAVLVEVGFITNPEEERRLASEAHQGRIVDAIVRGLSKFLRERRR